MAMNVKKIIELFSELSSELMFEKPNIIDFLETHGSDNSKKLIKMINDYDDLGGSILEELEEIKDED